MTGHVNGMSGHNPEPRPVSPSTVSDTHLYDVVGDMKADVAAEFGFGSGVKVIAGAGDNAAAAVGTGTVGDGMCNISLGTSGTIFISSSSFGVDDNNALHSFAHAAGYYHLMGCRPVSYTHLAITAPLLWETDMAKSFIQPVAVDTAFPASAASMRPPESIEGEPDPNRERIWLNPMGTGGRKGTANIACRRNQRLYCMRAEI